MDKVAFGQSDIEQALAAMTDAQLDQLSFGAILVDAHGQILKYNAAEGAIAQREPAAVIGRNFFRDVAPCTNNDDVFGTFRKGVADGDLDATLEMVFDYRMTPTKVRVHMKKAAAGDSYWLLVKRV